MTTAAGHTLGRRSLFLGRGAAAQPAALVASISPQCFALRGIACMSCHDACPTGAVRFKLAPGGATPRIDLDTCTGCGDCLAVCPASAILLLPVARESPDA